MNKRTVAGGLLSAGVLLCIAGPSEAGVRILLRPWAPRAIVVAPLPVPVPVPPPPPPRAEFGYIDLNVQPQDASVYVDEVYRGTARDFVAQTLTVPRGLRKITLRRNGFFTETFNVQIEAGRVLEMDVILKSSPGATEQASPVYQVDLTKTGSLVLQIEPADASVYIDDTFYGPSTQFSKNAQAIVLRAGQHKFQLSRPGYATHSATVEIQADQVKEVQVSLQKASP
jgi:hypothetical protein